MSDIKFLSNGKKVAVVGKFNANEYIVQEIHVSSSGAEIPAGDNFIVKSILDEPMQTWQQKEVEKYKERLDSIKLKYDKASAEVEKYQRIAAAKVKVLRDISSNAVAEHLETLEAFVSGEIKYLVIISRWSGLKVVSFNEAFEVDERHYEGIKLLSLFGRSDGNLYYQVNQYKDSSGSFQTVEPCRSLDAAANLCQRIYDEAVEKWLAGDSESPPTNDFVMGVEINLNPHAVNYWIDLKKERKAKKIQDLKDRLAELESEEV